MNVPEVTIESLRTTVNVLKSLIDKVDRYKSLKKEFPERVNDIDEWIQETENSGKLMMDVLRRNAEYFVNKALAGKCMKRVFEMRNVIEVEYFKYKDYCFDELDAENFLHFPLSTIYGQHLTISYDKLDNVISEVRYKDYGSVESINDIDVILENMNGWEICDEDEYHSVMGNFCVFINYIPKN